MTAAGKKISYEIKTPAGLSPRIESLRDYYFKGAERAWNNESTAWTTGTPWDVQFNEMTFYIVPETYMLMQTMLSSYRQAARPVALPADFWAKPIVERRAWFIREVMVNYLPKEILPGDLIAGGRFNIQASMCLTESEQTEFNRLTAGKNGARAAVNWFHGHGYGNAGATCGHLIPDYKRVLAMGWKGIYQELEGFYEALPSDDQKGQKGAQFRAMMTAATMPRDLAEKYSAVCHELSKRHKDLSHFPDRSAELEQMAENLKKVPWEPPKTFWQAVQALWLTHMLVMSDENYPGPGVSFGRIDQYLLPFWQYSLENGMSRDFGKEILKCFWIHANTAYDAMIRNGNQGITSGFGQLITLSGLGKNGEALADKTNDLTFAILEVIDEMSPILEPKPNIRMHRNTPDALLDKMVDMVASSQGAPFLINFDERSMAGMMREATAAGIGHLINRDNVYDYCPVGCLENTMAGNDRSGTVDCNLNLLKAVELALTGGKDLLPFVNPMTFKKEKIRRHGPDTGDAAAFQNWEEFWTAYKRQARYIIQKCVDLYEQSESVRTRFLPTPYLSCLVKGCAEDARENPQDYRHLLVRITGYNAYFTSVGRELQNEVIARLSHEKF